MSKTLIIADIGANADGSLDKMLRAIDVAKACGVDVFKAQWTSDPHLMAKRRGKALEDGYEAIYRRYLAWPAEWHADLAGKCQVVGVEYMCTAFVPQDVAVILPYVWRCKVASFEAQDGELIAQYHIPVRDRTHDLIVSVGMAAEWYCAGPNTFHLLCTSAYPAPVESLGLARIRAERLDGFSDHSDPHLTWTGALAVAAGATIIEAHLRLDDTDPANPDYPHAMTPAQFTEYVEHIRFCEKALGSGEKKMQPCEEQMSRYRVQASADVQA